MLYYRASSQNVSYVSVVSSAPKSTRMLAGAVCLGPTLSAQALIFNFPPFLQREGIIVTFCLLSYAPVKPVKKKSTLKGRSYSCSSKFLIFFKKAMNTALALMVWCFFGVQEVVDLLKPSQKTSSENLARMQ